MIFMFGCIAGFQSEFLSYVKRNNNAPGGLVARTTSRYGRPLGTTASERRSSYIEYAPAARKFPDNSPTGLDAGRKLSAREARERAKEDHWEQVGQNSTERQTEGSETDSNSLKTELGPTGFPSSSFYRKDVRMKDRDHDDARSTVSDTASRTSEAELSERRSRRRSPSASVNGDDKRGRVKSTSPATNGSEDRELRSSRSSPSPMLLDDRRRVSGIRRLSLDESGSVQATASPAILVKSELETQSECGQEESTSNKNSLSGSHEKGSPPVETLLSQRPKRNIIPKNLVSVNINL